MTQADCVHSTPRADSPSETHNKPTEGLDLAMLRFVRCLVGHGATIEEPARSCRPSSSGHLSPPRSCAVRPCADRSFSQRRWGHELRRHSIFRHST
jgi:hypothetical protein